MSKWLKSVDWGFVGFLAVMLGGAACFILAMATILYPLFVMVYP